MNRIIEIVDGKVVEVHADPDPDMFVNTLIDATELVQKAEQFCPDETIRMHIHRALLELTSAVAEAAIRVMPRRVH